MRRTLLLAVTALVLAGCTVQAGPPATPKPAPTAPAADPVGLINMWRVSDAEGTGPDSWLRLDGSEWMAWVDCGVVGGDWKTSGGLLIASAYMAMGPDSTSCLGEAGALDPSVDWMLAARSFTATADGYDLLDTDGGVVASLSVDGNPPTSEYFQDSYTLAPEVTGAIRDQFAPPAALPDGTEPATDILGRWEPDEVGTGEHPYVEFKADGSWAGSDGCNGMSGRWAQGPDGLFLGTGGFSTLIGCLNSPAPSWVYGAARLGITDGDLTFFDASGSALGSLHRT